MASFVAPFSLLRPIDVDPFGKAAQLQQLQALGQLGAVRAQQMQLGAVELQEAQQQLRDQQLMGQALPAMLSNPDYRDKSGNIDWVKLGTDLPPDVTARSRFGLIQMGVQNQKALSDVYKNNSEAAEAAQRAQDLDRNAKLATNDLFANVAGDALENNTGKAALYGKLTALRDLPGEAAVIDKFIGGTKDLPDDQWKARLQQAYGTLSPQGQQLRTERKIKMRSDAGEAMATIINPTTGEVDPDRYDTWYQTYGAGMGAPSKSDPDYNKRVLAARVKPEDLPQYLKGMQQVQMMQQGLKNPQADMDRIDAALPPGKYPTANANAKVQYQTALTYGNWEGMQKAIDDAGKYGTEHAPETIAAGAKKAAAVKTAEIGAQEALQPEAYQGVEPEVARAASQKWLQALMKFRETEGEAESLHNMLLAATGGNKEANAFVPIVALRSYLNRITQMEQQQLGQAGGVVQRVQTAIEKGISGQVPANLLQDFDQIARARADLAYKKLESERGDINTDAGTKIKPLKREPWAPWGQQPGAGGAQAQLNPGDKVTYKGKVHIYLGKDPTGKPMIDPNPLPGQ